MLCAPESNEKGDLCGHSLNVHLSRRDIRLPGIPTSYADIRRVV